MKRKKKAWIMPDWMEPYRQAFCNTGGNTVECLVNGDTDPVINLPVSTLEACVKSQVLFLEALKRQGRLR
jgi:hypothetical protein